MENIYHPPPHHHHLTTSLKTVKWPTGPLKGYESAYLLVLQPLELHVNVKTETIKERMFSKKKKKLRRESIYK